MLTALQRESTKTELEVTFVNVGKKPLPNFAIDLDFVHVWPGCLEIFVLWGVYLNGEGFSTPSCLNKSPSLAIG